MRLLISGSKVRVLVRPPLKSLNNLRFSTQNGLTVLHLVLLPQRGSYQNMPQSNGARWTAYANFTFINATYQVPLILPSPNSPFADESHP